MIYGYKKGERRNCHHCGRSFVPDSRSDQIFCNKSCRIKHYSWLNEKPRCSTCYKNKNCKVGGITYKGKRRPQNCPRKGE